LAIVAVEVVDANAVLGVKLLKRVLGSDSLDGGIINLVMHKMQSGVMVHKNGATPVPLLGEFPLQLGKKSPPWLILFGQLRLYPPAWLQQRLHEKRNLGHRAEQTSCGLGWLDMG
jgi:hypothetical protein